MKKALFLGLVAILILTAMPAAASGSTTTNYPNTTLSNWEKGNFADVWDLTQGDLTLSYTINMAGITTPGWAVTEVGLRQIGAPNIDPNYQGGWMQSNYITGGSNPTSSNVNDMHQLSKHGWLEQTYDASGPSTLVTPYWSNANYGFWFDRDGVDSTQAGLWGAAGTYNTAGIYHITIFYHALDAATGTMFATINGVQQGLYTAGWKDAQPELYPRGRSFVGDMTKMQVFYGRGGGDGTVGLSNISVTVTPASVSAAWVDDDWKNLGPGSLVDGNKYLGYNAFAHIQDAVNAVNPVATITVYPGVYGNRMAPRPSWCTNYPTQCAGDVYAPALIVYKDGLVIQADSTNPGDTLIETDYHNWSNQSAVLWSTANNVSTNAAPSGVIIIANNVTVRGFTIRSTYLGDPGQQTHPNTAGVFLGGTSAGNLAYVGKGSATIENNVISGWSGVYNWKSPNNTFSGNTVKNISRVGSTVPMGNAFNVWDGWAEGSGSSSGLKFLNNTIDSTDDPGSTAVSLAGVSGLSGGNPSTGVDHSNLYIDGNTISSGGNGISLWGSFGTNKVLTCNNTVVVPDGRKQVYVDWGTFDGPFPDCTGPVTSDVSATSNPAAVNAATTLTAHVDDSTMGGSKIKSAEYRLNDGAWSAMAAQDGAFDEVSENVTASFNAPSTAGVYDLCVRGTDTAGGSNASGNTGESTCTLFVVYDPTGGFVTGGGWIDSPLGAYAQDPALTGKATFGFVSKYQKGAIVPTGNTQFQFQVANLNFKSTSYEWLVIAGAKAQFKGSGTINGTGDYKFMLTATDGQIAGGGGIDKFRIKIWVEGSDTPVYDNVTDTELGGSSIVIHK